MDDYLSENEQWERAKEWLRENGLWIIAGLVIGGLGIGGWRWWQARTNTLALEAGALYGQVLDAFNQGHRAQGLALIDDLTRAHAGSPYVDQANLAAAREFVEADELPEAAKRLGDVVHHARDPLLAAVARLRLARVEIGMGRPDAALATLAQLGPAHDAAFAARSHEIRGDAYYAKGEKGKALQEYRAALLARSASGAQSGVLKLKIEDLEGAGASLASVSRPGAASASAAKAGR